MPARPALGRSIVLASVLAVSSATLACSSSSGLCVAEGTVTATVTDMDVDSDSNFVCNATVTITPSGGGSATLLTPQGFDGSNANCIYITNVPPGTYTVMATDTGYIPMSLTTTVTQVGCVTKSPMVMLGLFETQQGNMADAGSDASSDASLADATAE